jgi:N6-adenosine-specific RNA methylase IME4
MSGGEELSVPALDPTDMVLSKLDFAKLALSEARTLQDVKQIADVAEAARVYAKRVVASMEAVNYAAEIKVRAERRLGEILLQTPKHTGTRGQLDGYAHIGPSDSEGPIDAPPKLSELGIDYKVSMRSQQMARIEPERFERILEEQKAEGEVRSSAIIVEARKEEKEAAHEAFVSNLMEEGLSGNGKKQDLAPYDLILADPPWRYKGVTTTPDRTIENHYPTCTVEEIISHRPDAAENSLLFLWATVPLLPEALQVMSGWGFTYKSNATWDKLRIGMGYWWRIQHEHLLLGVKGKVPVPDESVRVSSVYREARTKHSRKPLCVYEWIEKAFPGKNKLEMYARSPRHGWAAWGNEVVAP